jgi:hypothetical protein
LQPVGIVVRHEAPVMGNGVSDDPKALKRLSLGIIEEPILEQGLEPPVHLFRVVPSQEGVNEHRADRTRNVALTQGFATCLR